MSIINANIMLFPLTFIARSGIIIEYEFIILWRLFTMAVMKLSPAFKDYLWGGTRLRDDFRKDCDFDKIAEKIYNYPEV